MCCFYLRHRRHSFSIPLGIAGHDTQKYLEFLDLVLKMLDYNPLRRIKPKQALRHTFFEPVSSSEALTSGQNNLTKTVTTADLPTSERFSSGSTFGQKGRSFEEAGQPSGEFEGLLCQQLQNASSHPSGSGCSTKWLASQCQQAGSLGPAQVDGAVTGVSSPRPNLEMPSQLVSNRKLV